MDFTVVLTHLQNQFSGQLVLYVDDIARVLGKSEKAISNLIARDSLPFKVKTVGGLRCVDVFQVAQWLASDAEVAQEAVQAPDKPNKPSKPTNASKGTTASSEPKAGRVRQPAGAVEATAPSLGLMGARILAMRHDAPQALARFTNGLRESDELAFMQEVLEKLFFNADLVTQSYVVTLKKLAPRGYKVLAEETRKYFEGEDQAMQFLTGKLVLARYGKSKHVLHFVLEKSTNTLFHAIASHAQLSIVKNSVGLELPGL